MGFSGTFAASSADPSWIIPIAIFTIITRVMRSTWVQLVKTVIPFGSSTFILIMAPSTETISTPKIMHNKCVCQIGYDGKPLKSFHHRHHHFDHSGSTFTLVTI